MTRSGNEEILSIFNVRERLPDQVFRRATNLGFLFTDSAVLTAHDLWLVLELLAQRFGDKRVVAQVIERRGDGGQELNSLPSLEVQDFQSGPSSLRKWLNHQMESGSEPLYIYIRVVAFMGDAGDWGLWSEQDRELAVLGIPASDLGPLREVLTEVVDWPWHEVADVAELLQPSFYPDPVPKDFLRDLRREYSVARI